MNRCPISCELHDYIEIACLYGYRVQLELKNNRRMEGKAKNIITTAEKREFLILDIDNGRKQRVELNRLAKMRVLSPHAVFKEIAF